MALFMDVIYGRYLWALFMGFPDIGFRTPA